MGQTLSEFDFSVVGRYALNIILITLQLFFFKKHQLFTWNSFRCTESWKDRTEGSCVASTQFPQVLTSYKTVVPL